MPVPANPGTTGSIRTIDRFAAAARASGADVHRARSVGFAAELARELAGAAPVLVTAEVAVDTDLAELLGADLLVVTEASDAADQPVALERARLGVAETGSVLVAEVDRASRLATMLARRLVVVVDASDIVDSLDDAGRWLATHAHEGYAALVTGPSRTADIERVLTVGVQGPAQVHLVIVDDERRGPTSSPPATAIETRSTR